MSKTVFRLILAGVGVLVLLNVFQFLQVNTLQSENSSLQNEVDSLNTQMDDLRKADPKLINAGFVGSNFTGVIYNRGLLPAHDVKVILHTGSTNNEWTYEINVGEVDWQDWAQFNEYIPTPEQYKYDVFRPEIRWLP